MTDDRPPDTRIEQWVTIGATIVAPATVFGAVLFYFGYVSSRSQYAYFGIDVDTIGLSTQGYIMHSPQPLLVPLLVLTLLGAGFLTLNTAIRRRIAAAIRGAADGASATGQADAASHADAASQPDAAQTADTAAPGAGPAQRIGRIRHVLRWSRFLGLALLSTGVGLLVSYAYFRNWALYALVTPLLIAAGAALTAYAARLLRLLPGLQHQQAAAATDAGRPSPAPADPSVLARWSAGVLVYVIIAASLFWVTATIAQWSGLGLARYDAQHLDSLPSVIVDTRERLFLRDPGIEETILPPAAGQTFRYRYRGLRLLIESQSRMFLVPDEWSASDSTLIVALDGSVRIQFRFQNQPP